MSKKLLVFGDSIAWGAFDEEKAGWVERLKIRYLKNFKTKGVGVYNLAVSSNDSQGVLFQLENDSKKMDKIEPEREGKYALFSIGCNEAPKDGDIDLAVEKFGLDLKEIAKIARNHFRGIIFTGVNKVDEKLTTPWEDSGLFWRNSELKRYDEIIEDFCQKEGLRFIQFWDLLESEDLSDGLHPNTRGHEKIFRRVKERLEGLL
jgi:lysophospholipase L1-like esterase